MARFTPSYPRQDSRLRTPRSLVKSSAWRLSAFCSLCIAPLTIAWSKSRKKINTTLSGGSGFTTQVSEPELDPSNQEASRSSPWLDTTADRIPTRHNSSTGSHTSRRFHGTSTSFPAKELNPNSGRERGGRPFDFEPSTRNFKLEQSSDLAEQLREISKQRAMVYHEKLGVQEQTRDAQNKRNEVAKSLALLQQELQPDRFDYVRLDQLNSRLQAVMSILVTAESQMDHLNENLMESERQLKSLEDQLYSNLTGDEIQSRDDILNNILKHMPSLPNTPQGHYLPSQTGSYGSIEVIEMLDPVNSTDPAFNEISVTRDLCESPRNKSVEDITHKVNVVLPILLDGSSLPDLGQLFEESAPASASAPASTGLPYDDTFTQCVGDQFPPIADDIGDIEEVLKTSKERSERTSDLASILEMKPVPESIAAIGPPSDLSTLAWFDTFIPTLEYSISAWLLQIFAHSWLELWRLVWVGGEYLEKVFSIIGYINFKLLVYENWKCDETVLVSYKVQSLRPSNSSNSRDVPQYFRQVFVSDSNDEGDHIQHFQLSLNAQPKLVRGVSNVAQKVESRRSTPHSHGSSKESKVPQSIFSFSPPKRIDTGTDFNGSNFNDRKHSITTNSRFQR